VKLAILPGVKLANLLAEARINWFLTDVSLFLKDFLSYKLLSILNEENCLKSCWDNSALHKLLLSR
jgi:hypothetical protein